MKTLTLKVPLKLKDGTEFNPGDAFYVVEFTDDNRLVRLCEASYSFPTQFRLKIVSLHKYFSGVKKMPSLRTIEKQEWDGYGMTCFGKRVEPDGHDEFGAPAWPLVLGII